MSGAYIVAALSGAAINGQQTLPSDTIVLGVWLIAAIATLKRRNWGRIILYPFSALLLLGVPLGTVLGGFMIYHLTKHRDLFIQAKMPAQN